MFTFSFRKTEWLVLPRNPASPFCTQGWAFSVYNPALSPRSAGVTLSDPHLMMPSWCQGQCWVLVEDMGDWDTASALQEPLGLSSLGDYTLLSAVPQINLGSHLLFSSFPLLPLQLFNFPSLCFPLPHLRHGSSLFSFSGWVAGGTNNQDHELRRNKSEPSSLN